MLINLPAFKQTVNVYKQKLNYNIDIIVLDFSHAVKINASGI
jgi:hypothetical protein